VIFCEDLVWNPRVRSWEANLCENEACGFKKGLGKDPELVLQKLKAIYRVLSTRGMKGTCSCFLDEATSEYWERIGAGSQ